MVEYPGGHATFLLAAIATHALIGYTVGEALFARPAGGTAAAIVPDADLLLPALPWPLVHRGLTHTVLAAAVAIAVAARYDRRLAGAVGAGYLSHLLIDATTAAGVPLAYPLVAGRVGVPGQAHAPTATLAIWAACLLVLTLLRSERLPTEG